MYRTAVCWCGRQARPMSSVAGGRRVWSWRAHQHGALTTELRREQAREPRLSSPDCALVRVIATTLNPIDVAMLDGYGAGVLRMLRGGDDPFPLVIGRDVVGIVERGARRGERVWAAIPPQHSGALAEMVLIRDSWMSPAPSRVPAVQSVAVPFAGLTAVSCARTAGLCVMQRGAAAGAKVLIYGLGGVGELLLQLLCRAGARVAAVCGVEQASVANEHGAMAIHRHHPRLEQQIRDGGPYDAVMDCAGLGGDYALPCDTKVYVTLSSPLLKECDQRGVVGGTLASVACLLRQNRRARTSVRWAYFHNCGSTLRALATMVDAGELSATVEVHSWLDGAWMERRTRGTKCVLQMTQHTD